MQSTHLRGSMFDHVAFFRSAGGQQLTVFIEGDGSPWTDFGTRIAEDPTPRDPLALRLALRTPGSVLYLGRPCYFEAERTGCSPENWTSGRYSEAVVTGLGEVLTRFVEEHSFSSVVLVGHSGGGTLATLMAPRLPYVAQVITIGANLDIAAWTALHGYLPLDGSLNPADLPPLPQRIVERHLAGARDVRVPPAGNARYLSRLPASSAITFPDFDHVCCWERDWRQIWSQLSVATSQQSVSTMDREVP